MASTPKKPFTSAAREAFLASPQPSNVQGLDEELQNALRNVGSRVRQNVSDGYASSRFTTPNTSPAKPVAPHSSPDPSNKSETPLVPTTNIFRSSADTLRDVYSTPPRPLARYCDTATSAIKSARTLEPPSRRVNKRFRDDDDDTQDGRPNSARAKLQNASLGEEDDAMDTDEEWNGHGIPSPFPPIALPRDIKPLKRHNKRGPGVSVEMAPVVQEDWRRIDISHFAKVVPD